MEILKIVELNSPNDCNGFDIVLANPPYIEFKKQSKELKDSLKIYKTAKGKFDVFVTFIEQSCNILKKNGIHCFINPTTFMKRDYGEATRKFINDNFEIKQILDFSDAQIFDTATTYTGIFIFQKQKQQKETFSYQKFFSNQKVNDDKMFLPVNTSYKESFFVNINELKKDSWVFLSPAIEQLFNKIKSPETKTMKQLCDCIFEGIASGKDDVFFIKKETIDENKLEEEIIHPLLKGENVKQYYYEWSGYYIIYPYDNENNVIPENVMKQKYPKLYSYLVSRRKDLSGRDYFDKSNKLWYELWNERKICKFFQRKIVNCEISADNRFALDDNNFLGNTKIFNSVLKKEYNHLYKYVVALLNSKVLNYFEKQISTPKAGGAYEHKTQFIEQFPIMIGTIAQQKKINDIVDEILSVKTSDSSSDTASLESQIDEIVFEIYGLTETEKNIIKDDGAARQTYN